MAVPKRRISRKARYCIAVFVRLPDDGSLHAIPIAKCEERPNFSGSQLVRQHSERVKTKNVRVGFAMPTLRLLLAEHKMRPFQAPVVTLGRQFVAGTHH